jgi:hypothetical protein
VNVRQVRLQTTRPAEWFIQIKQKSKSRAFSGAEARRDREGEQPMLTRNEELDTAFAADALSSLRCLGTAKGAVPPCRFRSACGRAVSQT